ncbi:MAG: formylglycine-generating enzyme family protein [Bacteroidales bacterium]|nr:formylglycine-generating enzyme family protein [Bacteroidales bacterium]
MKRNLFLLAFLITNIVQSQVTADSEMVLIPAGEFTMGKNSGNPTDWQPEHKVYIDAFYMDKYEVTNKQYYDFCIKTNNPLPEFWGFPQFKCSLDYPDHPVVGVSYSDADKYAKWAGKRLPTEAEWEYTARGGLANANFPWGNQIDSTKVNYGKRYKTTLKVGTFKPNGFGLFDIAGNVWEWTSDNYGSHFTGMLSGYYGSSAFKITTGSG